MNSVKNLGKSFLLFLGSTILLAFFLNTLYYFNLLSDSILSILSFLLPLLFLFIISLFLGKKASKLGYLEGIKLGGCVLLFYLFFSIVVFHKTLSWKMGLFYLIFLLVSILGSMIGINQKD